jgi:hypothetical protein
MKGGVKDLVASIAAKYGIEPSIIFQTTHVDKNGLHINVDDDVVHRIPENQEMALEFSSIARPPLKREWDGIDDASCGSEELNMERIIESMGYELRLIF